MRVSRGVFKMNESRLLEVEASHQNYSADNFLLTARCPAHFITLIYGKL